MTTRRRPWVAALLTLLLPGLGHLYAGYPRAALIAYAVNLTSFGLFLASWILLPVAPWNIFLGLLVFPGIYLAILVDSVTRARGRDQDYQLRGYNRWYVYAGLYLLFAVLLLPAAQNWLKQDLEAFRIPSGAMEPTLQIGEFLYVAKWPSMRANLTHGSVVVFDSVEEPGLKVVKRVAGLPGDTIAMVGGVFLRNGRPAPEPYLPGIGRPRSEDADQRAKMRAWQVAYVIAPDTADYAPDLGDWGPLIVPDQSFFALGDNREASYDSRYYGFVPTANVLGQPVVIYFSYDPEARGSLLAKVRWNRVGQRPR